jgi:hypothetical protein
MSFVAAKAAAPEVPTAAELPALFAGARIIDCDSHFTEPADLWPAHAPGALKSRVLARAMEAEKRAKE